MNPLRVVTVDDEVPILEELCLFPWDKYACRLVGQARSGREALALIANEGAEILLTDIVMPGMDGLALTDEVRRRFPDVQIILLTLYRDFEYARKAVHIGVTEYLLKGVYREEELGDALGRARSELGKLRLRRAEEDGSIIEFLEGRQGRPVDVSYPFRLCLISVTARGVDSLEVAGWLADQVEVSRVPMWRLPNGRFHLHLRVDTPEYDVQETLFLLVQKLRRRFAKVNLGATGAVGPIVRSDQGYRQVHREALRTLKSAFYSTKRHLASWDPHPQRRLSDDEVLDWTLRMRAASGNRSDLEEFLAKALPAFLEKSRIDPEDVRSLLTRWLHEEDGRATLMDRGFDYSEMANEFLEAIGTRPTDSPAFSRREVDRAILYLRKNLDRQVSLQELADRVGLSANYLGSLLRQALGQTFKQYLNRLRMERAADLVVNTDLKVYQIAHQVGFANYRYFSELFHQQFGMSPQIYRRKATWGHSRHE